MAKYRQLEIPSTAPKKWGGKRLGAGRKSGGEKTAGRTVSAYLSGEDLAYLALWGESNTEAVRSLLDRARRLWPKGL